MSAIGIVQIVQHNDVNGLRKQAPLAAVSQLRSGHAYSPHRQDRLLQLYETVLP